MSEDQNPTENKFPRGARPTPRHRLAGATPFRPLRLAIPTEVAYIPKQLSMWGNSQFGDCVSAEEAFNKAASGAFIQEAEVVSWARQNGFLNGADLAEVMDAMARSGFKQESHTYGDGGYKAVDYSNEAFLQAALAIAPVKIGIDANALPSGAGNANGWHGEGGGHNYRNEDHCVALAGYGTAAWLYQQLGMPVPSGVDPSKFYYLLFTWSTIGLVDHPWIMSTVGEAWLRDPSTVVDGQPQPNPGPKPPSPATVSVSVDKAQVQYGDTVTITVSATGAKNVGCDGQVLSANGGTVQEVASMAGDNTVTAYAVGQDGIKVTATTKYNVAPPVPPTPPAPPSPPTNSGLPWYAWVAIGAAGVLAVTAIVLVAVNKK